MTTNHLFMLFQQVFNLLGFICVLFSTISHATRCGWFNTVAMFGFWMTGILLAFYLFHMVEKLNRIPWLKIVRFYSMFKQITLIFYFLEWLEHLNWLYHTTLSFPEKDTATTASGLFDEGSSNCFDAHCININRVFYLLVSL